jgi:PAS domain S-box-containing protein
LLRTHGIFHHASLIAVGLFGEGAVFMRYRIAFLISDFIVPYHRENYDGIASAAEKLDMDLVAIACGTINDPDRANIMRTILYNYIDPDQFDGFIIPFSALSQYGPKKELFDILKSVLLKPTVFIGVGIDGYSCVTPDYEDGMRQIVEHMVALHSVENFIFIRGPKEHITSNTREKGLCSALKMAGINDSNITIIDKRFDNDFAAQIVEECEAKNLIHPKSVILFSGEGVAIETVHQLKIRGYSVPEDIIVCGTSQNLYSRSCNPSLTTVDNHFEIIGRKSVEILHNHITKGYSPEIILTETQLIPRASCGCIPIDDVHIFLPDRLYALGSYLQTHKNGNTSQNNLFSNMHTTVKNLFQGDNEKYFFSALEQSCSSFIKSAIADEKPIMYDHLLLFRKIGNSLITNLNLSELFKSMKSMLNIRHCFLAEYFPRKNGCDKLRLKEAYSQGQKIDTDEIVYDTKNFFPPQLKPLKRSTIIIEPLFYENEHLGILAIDYYKMNVLMHESLRTQICGALKNLYQRDELLAAEERFYDMAHSSSDWLWETDCNGIIVFSSGIIDSLLGYSAKEMTGMPLFDVITVTPSENNSLYESMIVQKTVLHRIETEGHSRYGTRLVFELSAKPIFDNHGIFTGFRGACKDITSTKMSEETMQKLLDEKETLIRELYHRTKNNMQVICSLMGIQSASVKNDSISLIFKEMEYRIKTMSLVHEKLYQSKDLSRINMKEYIRDLTSLLSAGYTKGKGPVIVSSECTDDIFVLIDTAIPCGMILNELISNAFKYAFPDGRSGEINISLTRTAEGVITMIVADNGIGFDHVDKIRSKSGMGLKVMFALAENQLSGKVNIENKNGTKFTITFNDIYYKKRV